VIRFGLIGYGAWGRHHAEAIAAAPGARLAAIACATEATAAAARRDFPDVAVHLDYRDVLRGPDVDAVDIVLPNDLHATVGVAALEHGKDVLLEKPMARTPDECDALIAAAARSGRVLSIGHERRLSAQWGRIKATIDAGDIGEPLYALFELFRFPYRRGAGGWRYDRERVGSWILEEPVHAFDFALWYFERAGDPVAISAFGSGPALRGTERDHGMPDSFSAVVRFPGGRHAVITQTLAAFEYHQVVEMVGAEGAVRGWWSGALDRTLEPRFELRAQLRGRSAPEVIPIERSGEVFELREQLARTVAAFGARRALVTGEEARKRVIMCVEAERSIREGREIPLVLAAPPGSRSTGRPARG
jgi:myo-inositol 2-dehydrogenase/D-chiro-inositol 1-dehydrogenase